MRVRAFLRSCVCVFVRAGVRILKMRADLTALHSLLRLVLTRTMQSLERYKAEYENRHKPISSHTQEL